MLNVANPASLTLNVIFSTPLKEEGILFATDAGGSGQFKVSIPRQTIRKEIDIAELSSGIYFLTLVTESVRVTRKFVKITK